MWGPMTATTALRGWASLGLAAWLAGCAAAPPAPAPLPEAASGSVGKALQSASRFMVSAAHPLAVQAGVQVLQRGGSAVDAGIAMQLVLALVEPQASGIGGGAFALHWDGRTVQAWDGRETAPAAADEALFLSSDGKPLAFAEAAVGGRAVGVPGVLKMLEQAHRQHGRRPWAELFEPAIMLAEQGFAVSPRLHALLATDAALKQDARAAAYFYRADGTPHPVGPCAAQSGAGAGAAHAWQPQGAPAFYQGPLAAGPGGAGARPRWCARAAEPGRPVSLPQPGTHAAMHRLDNRATASAACRRRRRGTWR